MKQVLLLTLVFSFVHYGMLEVIQDRRHIKIFHRDHHRPCMRNPNNDSFNQFVHKHIFNQESFDIANLTQWTEYLQRQQLCDRPVQSFINASDEKMVTDICNGSGRRLDERHPGNLCISDSRILVYNIRVTNATACTVSGPVVANRTYVIVACEEVNDECLPVHYQGNTGEKPDGERKLCSSSSVLASSLLFPLVLLYALNLH